MLRELLTIFQSQSQGEEIAQDLGGMIERSVELVREAGDRCFQRTESPADAKEIRKGDKEINRLQRSIRKQTFVEMAAGSGTGGVSLAFGVSITDKCIDWDTTERVLREARETLG